MNCTSKRKCCLSRRRSYENITSITRHILLSEQLWVWGYLIVKLRNLSCELVFSDVHIDKCHSDFRRVWKHLIS